MSGLSREQLDFLRSQRIPLSLVFDATGMQKGHYATLMKEGGYSIAYGTTPCARGGHTLRTRAGHCIQCDTAKIAYQLRHRRPGYVYLAGSAGTGLLKIGTTSDLSVREWQLRDWAYGGANDWEMLATGHSENAGAVEFAAHDRLRLRSVSGSYRREGRLQACYELFRCGYDEARSALVAALPADTKLREMRVERSRHLWPSV